MRYIHLEEKQSKNNLQPFSLLRSVADIRVGIYTFKERWIHLGYSVVDKNESERLRSIGEKVTHIPASLLPINTAFESNDLIESPELTGKHIEIRNIWDIPGQNALVLQSDFLLATAGKVSVAIPSSVKVTGSNNIFIEEGAVLEHCYLNTTDGPVYISKHALIMDGAMLRGPLFIGEGSVIKMGATIYGGSFGSYCIIGGEVKNSVFMSFSNKAHHGYIGDSVVGEWCNLGAGTTCSNVKNTGGKVKLWDMHTRTFNIANNKCGVFMGDYSRCAINTSFNTGTVTGICTNIFNGQQLTPKFIPSFSWGVDGKEKYNIEKALTDVNTWMQFKKGSIDESTINKLRIIYQND